MSAQQIAAARLAFIVARASELRHDFPGMSQNDAIAHAAFEWEGE